MNLKNLSLAGLALALIAILSLLFTQSFFAFEPVGITIQVLAALLMVWARLTFGRRSFHAGATPTEGGLVLYFAWTGIVVHFSLSASLLGIALTAGLSIRMLAEERLVAEKYPEYAAYAAHTKRVIPYIL